MKRLKYLLFLILFLLTSFSFYGCESLQELSTSTETKSGETLISTDGFPAYTGEAYVAINDNQPSFKKSDYKKKSFENYSELDSLGRCGVAFANVGIDLMPTQERGSISSVKPTGWQTIKYDIVDGKYLYNRCHLIGYQLTGENANKQNLITGTRYLNIDGMLSFENMVADYVKETKNHVLYRVTPVFVGDELVARGVQMEGWSVEDEGEGICFNVYAYNVQPGITIDYQTGESSLGDPTASMDSKSKKVRYILNTKTKKIHKPDCSSIKDIASDKKETYTGSKDDLLKKGYTACKRCNP
ncbi:DNA-entry nuclease (Competence-specific nuclease) [Lachnospiraceae bacterium TWA4]|nr:DNA-entry nuclease (Competence-specific nuclease) [Lachnospiraceae bacterium TWA4]